MQRIDPDWISPWWQAACLPERWRVCGVDVPSLTVWHGYALENIGNRFVLAGDVPPDKDDCASLLMFAMGDMDHGRRLMYSDGRRRFSSGWSSSRAF